MSTNPRRRISATNNLFEGTLPEQWAIRGGLESNYVSQLSRPRQQDKFQVVRPDQHTRDYLYLTDSNGRTVAVKARGHRSALPDVEVVDTAANLLNPTGFPLPEAGSVRWISPLPSAPADMGPKARAEACRRALKSWENAFSFAEAAGGAPGLRPPQLGALHGVLAHWAVRDDVATVVLPTGTGKTETMLALLVHERIQRLLVVVPTDRLRHQLADKFSSLGLLKSIGAVNDAAEYPVVGVLSRRFENATSAATFAASCNVIVTTMALLAKMPEAIRDQITAACSHLFVDEAHHVPAPTWASIRDNFLGKRVVQFTATPFRNDGKHVDGHVVFRYPLARAQKDGYFSTIDFQPIAEIVPTAADKSIATRAIGQLRNDLAAHYDHIVMARTGDIARAEDIAKLYCTIASDLGVVIIHSKMPPRDRQTSLARLNRREARVIVCVDMLGEGVDLPSLKIAAIHDAHRSLAITMQFVGRFARTNDAGALGGATVVANIADALFAKSLRGLYAQDSDWNIVLTTLSEQETLKHSQRDQFARSFEGTQPEIPLQNVMPKMSMVVYRSSAQEWDPGRAAEGFEADDIFSGPSINPSAHTIVIVTRHYLGIKWADVRELHDTVYHLHVAHWNPALQLFFVNSTDKDEFHSVLAEAVLGKDAELVRGETIFRALHGINRLQLMNLGLRHTVNQRIQFHMMMGHDIEAALTEAQQQNRVKSNLFGIGFEDGESVSLGCSHKGRVWAHEAATDITAWITWANKVGKKLSDSSITTADILRNVILPVLAESRPNSVPISIEWNVAFLRRGENHVFVGSGESWVPFFQVDLRTLDFSATDPIRFAVVAETLTAEYVVDFDGKTVRYVPVGDEVSVKAGHKELPLSDWFRKSPPVVRFADGSFLQGEDYCRAKDSSSSPFDRQRILPWAWDGVDPAKESQGRTRRKDSIQAKVIQDLISGSLGGEYEIVFDDDAPGEAADIVAIAVRESRIIVDLFHCKFAHGGFGASQVADLYEVCGQAQKSIAWCRDIMKLLQHLQNRERYHQQKYGATRFEKGGLQELSILRSRAPQAAVQFRIHIVQPGLSRTAASAAQLDLLGSTATYLQETFAIDLIVLASA